MDQEQQQQVPEQSPGQPARQPDVWNKDVVETGRWGSRSRKELFIVAGLSVLIIVVTVVGVLVGTKDARSNVDKNNNNGRSRIDPVTGKRVSTYQLPKPPIPTIVDEQGEWDAVREKFSTNTVLSALLTEIPATVAEIASQGASETADPYVRAAHWLTAIDTVNEKEWAPIRFALAAIYYSTGGTKWTNQTNWLSSTNHCQWHGIACCERMQASLLCSVNEFYNVVEIDLYNNSLAGTIPKTFGLFPDLQSLFLSENAMTGSINGDVFLGLQYFNKLYVQHNKLTGTIPLNLDANGKFDTLYVQGNMMTGTFPQDYCAAGTAGVASVGKLVHFGMDCDEVKCEATCCAAWENCFYNANTASA